MAKLYFLYAPMNAGKSMQLLAKAYNFEERNIPIVLLKPKIDNRDGENIIKSRALKGRECIGLDKNTNIIKLIEEKMIKETVHFKWILVDESQFLSRKQVNQLSDIVDNHNINVICYGLRTDFKSELFEGSKRLFEIADSIEELKCSCECGTKAIFNARFGELGKILTNGEQIEIGGNDRYISLCRKCYKEKLKEN